MRDAVSFLFFFDDAGRPPKSQIRADNNFFFGFPFVAAVCLGSVLGKISLPKLVNNGLGCQIPRELKDNSCYRFQFCYFDFCLVRKC